jgi:hypothetical protein
MNGVTDAGSQMDIDLSAYVLTHQVFDLKTTFTSSFNTNIGNLDWRQEFWSYQNSWSVVGIGVTIRLAVDGGVQITGNASGQPLVATVNFTPRAWVDAGGSLSATLFTISIGSISGIVHLADATATGTASVDANPTVSGGHATWMVSGMGQICGLGGKITGCIIGFCEDLVSWNNICPGFLSFSANANGVI